jgi:hypothetical protein
MFQEDGHICCRNKAKVLVRPKGMMMYSSKKTIRNTIKIVLQTEFDLTIAQLKSKIGKIVDPKRRYYLASTRQR